MKLSLNIAVPIQRGVRCICILSAGVFVCNLVLYHIKNLAYLHCRTSYLKNHTADELVLLTYYYHERGPYSAMQLQCLIVFTTYIISVHQNDIDYPQKDNCWPRVVPMLTAHICGFDNSNCECKLVKFGSHCTLCILSALMKPKLYNDEKALHYYQIDKNVYIY